MLVSYLQHASTKGKEPATKEPTRDVKGSANEENDKGYSENDAA